MAEPHRYRLYGLSLASEWPLPLLEPDDATQAHVTIHFSGFAEPTAPPLLSDGNLTVLADGRAVFTHPAAAARMLMVEGRRIVIDSAPSVAPTDLLNTIIGPGMTALFHQRGQPPLHAAVICIGDRGVALAGDSGAGKSTTSHALVARGHRLLADDLALVDPATLLVQPGLASSRLSEESASMLGLEPVFHAARDKSFITTATRFVDRATPLTAVVILSARPPDATVEAAQPIRRAEAPAYLDRMIARRPIGRALGQDRKCLLWATAIGRRVPVYFLPNPHNPAHLDRTCAIVEQTVANLVGRTAA